MYDTGEITKSEKEVLVELQNTQHFRSGFQFLGCHKGFRPSSVHVVMGVSHGGKSTLIRTILLDLLLHNKDKQIGVWLSEETIMDFKTEMSHTKSLDNMNHLHLFSEMDVPTFKDVKSLMNQINNFIEECKLDILFFDNVTTSFCYADRKVEQQSLVAQKFKNIASKYQVPVVLISHTRKGVSDNYDKQIDMSDIFGSSKLPRIANFFYIMQSYFTDEGRVNIINIAKHRGYPLNNKYFELVYYPKGRVFSIDRKIDFNRMKEIYKSRQRL